ncbi:hypothetical protein EMPS_11157 [Entomortierella parvispora]|uniref:Uncharacterized protein n=1 Tax=Entomortierella parvispora TaxID=205924 RepID=A0A9P3HM06_9FUNG|nr:hypothetical protein EMPS_11157 [Entomortierella parvispora]
MAVSTPIDIPRATTTSHDSPRSPLFTSPSRRSMSPMGGSAVGVMKKFLRRKNRDNINDDIHDDDLALFQPTATTISLTSSSVSMMQSFVLVGGYGAEPGSTVILDNISNGSDGSLDSHYGDMTDVMVGIAKTATVSTAASTTLTTHSPGSSSSNFFGRFSKDRSSINGHSDLGIPGSSSRKGRSRHLPGTENGDGHGSLTGSYGSSGSGLLAATAASMRRKLNRRSLSADSAPTAQHLQQQEQRTRKPNKSRPVDRSTGMVTTRSFEVLSDLDSKKGIQSPKEKASDDSGDNSFITDSSWSLDSPLGSQNFGSSYNISPDGQILDTTDKPKLDPLQKQKASTEKAPRRSIDNGYSSHKQRIPIGDAWASSLNMIASMQTHIDPVSEEPMEVAAQHGSRVRPARRQSESGLDRLEKVGDSDNFVLVAETSSPTQFYDASHTRDVLRKYLSVKSSGDLFDEMIECGFPSDGLESQDNNNDVQGGEDAGPKPLASDELPSNKDDDADQSSRSPNCRYMTLRITLTPWHARADECQLYGPASVSGRLQLKTRVNRFFSRSSNLSSTSLQSSLIKYPSSVSLHSAPLPTRSISSVLLSAANDRPDVETESTKPENLDKIQTLTSRSMSVAELREMAMQSTPTSPTTPTSPITPSSAPPSRPSSRAAAMNPKKSTRNSPTPPLSYRIKADHQRDTVNSRILSPPPLTTTFARSLRSPSPLTIRDQSDNQSQSPPRKGSLSALSLPMYNVETGTPLSPEVASPPPRRKGSTPAIFFSPAAAAAAAAATAAPVFIADGEAKLPLPSGTSARRSMTINVPSAQAGSHLPRAISPRYPFPEHYRNQERLQNAHQYRQKVTSPTLPPRKKSDQTDDSIHPMARVNAAEVHSGLNEGQHGYYGCYGYGSLSTPNTPLATSTAFTGQGEPWSPTFSASKGQYPRSGSIGSGLASGPVVPREQGRIRRAISKDDYLYQQQHHQEILRDAENVTGLENTYRSGAQEWAVPSLGSHSQNRRPSHQVDGTFYAPRTTASSPMATQPLAKQPRDPRRPSSRSNVRDTASAAPSPSPSPLLSPQQQQHRQGTRLFEGEDERRVQRQQSQDFPSAMKLPPALTAKSAYRQRQGSTQSNASSTATLSNDNTSINVPKSNYSPLNETMKTSNEHDRYEGVEDFGPAEYDTSIDPDLSFGSVLSTVSMPEETEDRGFVGGLQQGEETDSYPLPRPRPRRGPSEHRDAEARKGGCWRPIESHQAAAMTTFAFP